MPFGRIIVPANGTRLMDRKLESALSVARYFGSSIEILFLRSTVNPQSVEHNGSVSFRACAEQHYRAAEPPVQAASRIPSAMAVRRM